MANWSEIPDDITEIIAKRLPPRVEEFAIFSSVCKSWRCSAAFAIKKDKRRFSAPWLMLSKKDNDKIDRHNNVGEQEGIRSFYNLSTKKVFNLQLPTQGQRCWGTPYGWMVTFGLDLNIHLLNPFSRIRLCLPPFITFEHQHPREPHLLCKSFVRKFVVSSDHQCPLLVMAIYGEYNYLAISSPGDEAWTSLQDPQPHNEDILFFKGQFYVISTQGTLKICDINSTQPPKASVLASPPQGADDINTFYLVDMSGELHLVERAITPVEDGAAVSDFHFDTEYFNVFKFDFDTKEWIEVEDLGDHALFVGNSTSLAISTIDHPEFKGNCIYFTDDHQEIYQYGKFCDMGVYDLKEDTIDPIYFGDDELSKISRPIFFVPTP